MTLAPVVSKPSMPSALQERARQLAIAQDFGAEALDLNRRLVAENGADTGSRTRLARCYLQAGQVEAAEAEYREVLRLDPKNRIAAGGLAQIEQQRRLAELGPEPVRAVRSRAPRVTGASTPRSRISESPSPLDDHPVPQIFSGFERRDFAELQVCPPGQIRRRFAPRVVDLLKRVNALASSREIAAVREAGKKQLFRLSLGDVQSDTGHWYVFNMGGRWEAQFNIGMYAGSQKGGDWVRIGLGYHLESHGADGDAASANQVREAFRRLQALVDSPRRSLLVGWMIKEDGRVQVGSGGRQLDLRPASQATDVVGNLDAGHTDWLFCGKWLTPDNADDAPILADPVEFVRTVDRTFSGLLPLWRALHE